MTFTKGNLDISAIKDGQIAALALAFAFASELKYCTVANATVGFTRMFVSVLRTIKNAIATIALTINLKQPPIMLLLLLKLLLFLLQHYYYLSFLHCPNLVVAVVVSAMSLIAA